MPISEVASEISSLATRLSFGEVQAFRTLNVVPLLDPAAPPADYLTLDQALARGQTVITEVSDAGTVPALKVLNRGATPVFLLDGEELVGAKQNRILTLSILVPGASELEIPVACVEQGRWAWRGRAFASSDSVIFSKLRRSNAETISANLSRAGRRQADQGAVWCRIADKSARMSVHSDTTAASALNERYRQELDEFVAGIAPVEHQVGAAFLVNGRFAGLDVLAGPNLLAQLLPKLVRSYALDAVDDAEADLFRGAAGSDPIADVKDALARLARTASDRHRAVGQGEEVRVNGERLVGGALIDRGTTVHLGVWAAAYQ
jgi:hypothetical protein